MNSTLQTCHLYLIMKLLAENIAWNLELNAWRIHSNPLSLNILPLQTQRMAEVFDVDAPIVYGSIVVKLPIIWVIWDFQSCFQCILLFHQYLNNKCNMIYLTLISLGITGHSTCQHLFMAFGQSTAYWHMTILCSTIAIF